VDDAFREEQARLLSLSEHRFDTDLIVTARSLKTIYVRFDLNDYSIPPSAIGRALSLQVSPTTVRVLEAVASSPNTGDRLIGTRSSKIPRIGRLY
jgi:hypothetical protein